MTTNIMAVTLDLRSFNAPKVQEILTKHGCIIKMRLGLHETSTTECSETGLILLQLLADDEAVEALSSELLSVKGVKVNNMKI